MKALAVVGYLILAALGIIAAWFLLPPMPWTEWRADQALAAWVQAIGSVFAILLAIAVPAAQHILSERRIRDEAAAGVRRQHALAVMLAEEFLQICDSLLRTIDQERLLGGALAFPADSVADWREKFRSLDYSALHSEAATLLAETRRVLGRLEGIYRAADGRVIASIPNDGVHSAKRAVESKLAELRKLLVRERLA